MAEASAPRVLRASLVQAPGNPCAHVCQGLLSRLSTSGASLDPLKPISKAGWEHGHRAWCPLSWLPGSVLPQREVEKYSAGGPGNLPKSPGLPGRQDSISQHCSPTPSVSGASGRGALRADDPPGGTAEAGGKGLSRVYHQGPYPAPSQARADAEGSVHPGLPT